MPLTAPSVNDEKHSPQHSVPARHNIGVLTGKIRRYSGDGTNSQTITLSPPAQRVYAVRYFDTGAATYQNPWVTLKIVSALAGEAMGYTYTESTGVILFGNGTNGYKPASGLIIEVEYEAKHVGESTTAPGNMRIQDGDGTTLADVIAARKFMVYSGTVTGYTDGAAGPPVVKSTLTDANANNGSGWTVNEYANMLCVITEGPGRGQGATIESNTGTVLTFTVNDAFPTDPTTDSSYAIVTTLNALAVVVPGGIKVDQVNVEGFAAGEYRASLPTLANLQNSQHQLTTRGTLMVETVPRHGTGAESNTYNADGTIATTAWTLNGATFTRTYTYNADGTIASSAMALS